MCECEIVIKCSELALIFFLQMQSAIINNKNACKYEHSEAWKYYFCIVMSCIGVYPSIS